MYRDKKQNDIAISYTIDSKRFTELFEGLEYSFVESEYPEIARKYEDENIDSGDADAPRWDEFCTQYLCGRYWSVRATVDRKAKAITLWGCRGQECDTLLDEDIYRGRADAAALEEAEKLIASLGSQE